jgi:hypothetical protein
MTIRSFSGTHEFFPQCLAGLLDDWPEQVDSITEEIRTGWCPRCSERLPDQPTMPAGSRITSCRCVPICGPCGEDEAVTGVYHPGDWPLDPDAVRAAVARWNAQGQPAILTVDPDGVAVLLTEEGARPVRPRPHPGGWAEFGEAPS